MIRRKEGVGMREGGRKGKKEGMGVFVRVKGEEIGEKSDESGEEGREKRGEGRDGDVSA